MSIQAINTHYDGHYFRSRLEARWAVFFNAIGLTWEYEPEGFNFDGYAYLPDFYIPQQNNNGYYIEVKGGAKEADEDMLQSFTNNVDKSVLLVRNIVKNSCPYSNPATNIKIFLPHDGRGFLDSQWTFNYGHKGGYDTDFLVCSSCGRFYTPHCQYEGPPDYRCPSCLESNRNLEFQDCFNKARKARFEHGEKG